MLLCGWYRRRERVALPEENSIVSANAHIVLKNRVSACDRFDEETLSSSYVSVRSLSAITRRNGARSAHARGIRGIIGRRVIAREIAVERIRIRRAWWRMVRPKIHG